VRSKRRSQFIDFTKEVETGVRTSDVLQDVCYAYVPHTTARDAINEHAYPDVAPDVKGLFEQNTCGNGGQIGSGSS
jgi:thiamine phosphate synthase YjbQ (UPF0047 family)